MTTSELNSDRKMVHNSLQLGYRAVNGSCQRQLQHRSLGTASEETQSTRDLIYLLLEHSSLPQRQL